MCQCYTFPHSRADRNKCFIWAFNTEFDFQLLCLHLGSNKVGGAELLSDLMKIDANRSWNQPTLKSVKMEMDAKVQIQDEIAICCLPEHVSNITSKSNILNSEAEKCRWQYLEIQHVRSEKNTQLAISTGRNTCLTERVSNFTFSQTFWILSWSCVLELKLTFFILTYSPQFVSDCPALTLLRIL